MAVLSPMDDTYETLLTTLATAAVCTTAEPNFEVDGNALLPKTTSKHTTKPLVEMEPLLNEEYASFLDELDDVEERSEAEVLEELSTRPQHTRATSDQRTVGSEDALQSYRHD